MPITRRKRANPPDQPENNHQQPVDPNEGAVEQPLHTEPAPASLPTTERVENGEQPVNETPATATPNPADTAHIPPIATPLPANNGDRSGPETLPNIEGGRRTVRGELFRRPPHMPQQQQASFVSPAPLQAPTHEITLPLGNLLHLAYNPGYTGSEEARAKLLQHLSDESKAGGRARCWSCGSLAIAYDRWNTQSRSFGDVGVAFCEICGVWSVL
ncbi:MAG: hypothetical protein ABI234_16190 [Ktedonobacteraceae bacterium]